MDYLIRYEAPRKFTVVKWDNMPLDSYHIYQGIKKFICSCPDSIYRKVNCKHIEMVKECLRKGTPQPYVVER